VSARAARGAPDPQQLYELWERQQWQAHAIELDRDIEDWAAFPDEERADVLWGLSSFFVGEERVTTQFFSRFYDTVFSIGGGMDAQLQEVRAELNDAFVELFDGHLVDACNRLVADPADRNAKVDFVTTYHMGTLSWVSPTCRCSRSSRRVNSTRSRATPSRAACSPTSCSSRPSNRRAPGASSSSERPRTRCASRLARRTSAAVALM
jgi:hypothetical protein